MRRLLNSSSPSGRGNRSQDGGDDVNPVFPVVYFAIGAEIMRPKRRRLSPEARVRLAAVGAATQFVPGQHGTRSSGDELKRTQTGRLDLGTVQTL